MKIKSHRVSKWITAMLTLIVTLGTVGHASAECFEYKKGRGNDSTIVDNLKQRDIKKFRANLHRGQQGVNESTRNNRLYYTHPIWVPANGYLVVHHVSDEFEPEIIIDNGENNLVYSWPMNKKKGYFRSEVHLSGSEAHRNNDGHVNIRFTSINSIERGGEGRFSGWISLMERSNNINNSRFVKYNESAPCKSRSPVQPVTPSDNSDDDYNDCPSGKRPFLGGCI